MDLFIQIEYKWHMQSSIAWFNLNLARQECLKKVELNLPGIVRKCHFPVSLFQVLPGLINGFQCQ